MEVGREKRRRGGEVERRRGSRGGEGAEEEREEREKRVPPVHCRVQPSPEQIYQIPPHTGPGRMVVRWSGEEVQEVQEYGIRRKTKEELRSSP